MIGKTLRKIMQQLLLFAKKSKIYPAYDSRHNSDCEKQVIILMIPNGEKCHYLAVKKLPVLFKEITSKHHGDFYFLNCFHSFATERNLNRLKKHVKVNICNIHICNVIMSEGTKILEINQYQKPDKTQFIIYEDLECNLEKIHGCKNNP